MYHSQAGSTKFPNKSLIFCNSDKVDGAVCISCCQPVIATKRSCCQATYLKIYGQPYRLPRDTWYKLWPIAFPCLVSPGRGKPPALVHISQAHNVVTGKFLVSGLIYETFVEHLNFSIHQTTEYMKSCYFSAFVYLHLCER